VRIFRALGATFASAAGDAVGPLELVLERGELATLAFATAREASIAARMCAAIVTPTTGTIYVADFDTRLQPPAAKRRVGFVDAHGWHGTAYGYACEIAFRAEVWGLDVGSARDRAATLLAELPARSEPYAFALAIALVTGPELVVLDDPTEAYVGAARSLLPDAAVIATHPRV